MDKVFYRPLLRLAQRGLSGLLYFKAPPAFFSFEFLPGAAQSLHHRAYLTLIRRDPGVFFRNQCRLPEKLASIAPKARARSVPGTAAKRRLPAAPCSASGRGCITGRCLPFRAPAADPAQEQRKEHQRQKPLAFGCISYFRQGHIQDKDLTSIIFGGGINDAPIVILFCWVFKMGWAAPGAGLWPA